MYNCPACIKEYRKQFPRKRESTCKWLYLLLYLDISFYPPFSPVSVPLVLSLALKYGQPNISILDKQKNIYTHKVKGMRNGGQYFPGSTPQNHCAGWQRRCLWLQRLMEGKSFLSVIETPKRIVLQSHAALKAAWSDLGPTGPAKLTEKFRFTLNLILIPRKPNTLLSLYS